MSRKLANTTSDFIEWADMINLVRNLFDDGNEKMSLLIAIFVKQCNNNKV